MKQMIVGIVQNSGNDKYQNFNGFEFPSKEDESKFYEVVGRDPSKFMQMVGKKNWFQHWNAWSLLRKAGWVHDGFYVEKKHNYLIWVFPEDPVEKLELALKHHDWTFQYSDDYRVYKEGLDEETMIEELMKQVGEPLATEMLKKYRE